MPVQRVYQGIRQLVCIMSLSPVSSKSIVFLLGLLYLQAYTVDAAISTSAGFPQDVFAKPAFQVHLGGLLKDVATLPIKRNLIKNAQALLDPLKKMCLYHTTDWFTYSFCHGREIRQFRRLSSQTAAQKAFKKAGGGEAGKKAALEAAEKVNSFVHPVADPEYPAFILGRWTPQSEEIVGDNLNPNQQRQQQRPASGKEKEPIETSKGVAVSSNPGMPSPVNFAGLDLVEEVQFGDWDEEELFAAEAKALAQFKNSAESAIESNRDSGSADSQRHRYLTQRWTNGTMCDMNHQPRTVEVQFHCSNRKPLEDRIVMFKETTICNYVLVIETPRLCADPAFGSEKEDAPLPIQCHRVVDDAFAGPTMGDPEKVQPSLAEIQGKDAVTAGIKTKEKETASAEDASSTSHTFGDLSRYGSVHDDYFDEALGGHGALYHQYHHEHEHEHEHEHDHDHNVLGDDVEGAEIVVEVSMDQDGTLQVNKVVDSASQSPSASDSKEVRRREGGKKRSDDDSDEEEAMEIQLDMDDFLSVLRGEQGGSLESKLADKISKVLKGKMQQQHQASDAEQDGASVEENKWRKEKEAKGQTPDDVAKLYNKLMAGVTGKEAAKGKQPGKGAAGKQPPPLRMEKVGDSFSERVKRFYDAKEREERSDTEAQGKKREAAAIGERLEL
ncbi:hypothetical protein NDA16_005072 [Ustilago loliicola]|nr:hypothetical protein NDA16_005072 [Ustilago loliicola]